MQKIKILRNLTNAKYKTYSLAAEFKILFGCTNF